MMTLDQWHLEYDRALWAYKRRLRELRLILPTIVQHTQPEDPQLQLWPASPGLDKPVVTV